MGALERHWFAFVLAHTFLLQTIIMLLRIGATYEGVAIGLDAFWVGMVGGAFGLVPALLGLHMGRFIDRLGEQAAMLAGSLAILLAALGLWLIPSTLAWLLATSTLMGLGQFIAVAGQHSAVGRTEIARQSTNFGWLTMAISFAHAVGPLVISLFARGRMVPDTQAVFLTATVAAGALLVIALFVRMPANRPAPAAHGLWRTTAILLRTDGYLLATISSLIIFAAMDLLVIYLPLYATERGIPAATVGILLSIRATASMLSRFFFGWLVARVGRGRLLVLAAVASGVAIALLSFTALPALMGILLFAAGLGLGVGAPLTLSWVSEIAPSGMRGSALALRLAINRVGQAVMPVAMGALFTGVGAAAIIWAMSATLLATGAVSARYFSRSAGTGGRPG